MSSKFGFRLIFHLYRVSTITFKENYKNALFRLISDYLLMTKEDLELWGEEPEEFACEETGDRCNNFKARNRILRLFR